MEIMIFKLVGLAILPAFLVKEVLILIVLHVINQHIILIKISKLVFNVNHYIMDMMQAYYAEIAI